MEQNLEMIIAAAKAAAEKEVVKNIELDEDGNPESGDYPEELFFEHSGKKYVAVVENLDFDCNVWHSQGDYDVPESWECEVAWTEIKATIYYDGGENDGDKVTEFSHKW